MGIGRRGCFLFALHAVVVVVVVIFIIFSIDGSLLSLKQEIHLQQVQQIRAIEPAGTLLARACAARRCQLRHHEVPWQTPQAGSIVENFQVL